MVCWPEILQHRQWLQLSVESRAQMTFFFIWGFLVPMGTGYWHWCWCTHSLPVVKQSLIELNEGKNNVKTYLELETWHILSPPLLLLVSSLLILITPFVVQLWACGSSCPCLWCDVWWWWCVVQHVMIRCLVVMVVVCCGDGENKT